MRTIGNVTPTVGLTAAPDTANLSRLGVLLRRYTDDMAGGAGPDGRGIIGYDRGDPAHSRGGPVGRVASATLSIAAVTTPPANQYRPVAEFQNGISSNPGLDPYNRLLYARMQSAR